jgi:hypothetical protein
MQLSGDRNANGAQQTVRSRARTPDKHSDSARSQPDAKRHYRNRAREVVAEREIGCRARIRIGRRKAREVEWEKSLDHHGALPPTVNAGVMAQLMAAKEKIPRRVCSGVKPLN